MKKFIKEQFEDYKLLLRSVPSLFVSLYVVSIIAMNLTANKSVNTGLSWLALDCGFTVSWMSFLTMDTITKRFGPRAATKLSIMGVGINLLCCAIFFVISKIPGNWGEYYTFNDEIANKVLNNTFGGSWYVVFGSMTAFLTSAIVNNFLNSFIGKHLKNNNFKSFAIRSYISTAVGQFVDNLVFAIIVSYVLFGWNIIQVFVCALTGMIVELICEVIFSPLGYKTVKQWEADKVGQVYLDKHKVGGNN